MARIAVGGVQHETNVFAPYLAEFAVFEQRDEWPPLSGGAQMLDNLHGMNLPLTGAIERLEALGHEIVPLIWCSATPSAHVTEEAFERISAMMLEGLRASPPVDGVLLDLHGAMVCTHVADGDGELLRRVRNAVGDATPVVACLDLHANISDQMVSQASALEAYRTYPHVDMSDTGARAADLLDLLLQHKLARFPFTATRRTDFLIPPVWGCTLVDPAKSIYAHLCEQIHDEVAGISLACGFPLSDVPEAGPALVAYGFDETSVNAAADNLLAEIEDRESEFRGRLYSAEEAVSEAIRLSVGASGPVMLADSQDNPGGGGPGDTTEILRALVSQGATDAAAGVINDAQAVESAHSAGIDAQIDMSLGGKSGFPGSEPFNAEFRILGLSNGRFRATGPMLGGAEMDLGPTALLGVGGVLIVVGSKAIQTMDQSMFRHLDVEPSQQKIIAIKSSIHFRNDFQQIASAIMPVAAPGPVIVDLSKVSFKDPRLQRLTATNEIKDSLGNT
jgi:microcystin degradation protein MlrC